MRETSIFIEVSVSVGEVVLRDLGIAEGQNAILRRQKLPFPPPRK